ncbi:MAG: hypothetical protein IJ649_08125 [Oscillospiraceae bacterium]|nr:hypothetical protein [Oscillospiraceae bacterium]
MAKRTSRMLVLLFAACASLLWAADGDAERWRCVVGYLAPQCGGTPGARSCSLAEVVGLTGDTGRLARLLVDLAQTNDAWYAEMAMWQLETYATAEQLPFLHGCATNPAVGDRAVKTILRIEGMTTNSIASAQRYLALTNVNPSAKGAGTTICADLIVLSSHEGVSPLLRSNALEVAQSYMSSPGGDHYSLDRLLSIRDASYRYSKRRLETLRDAVVQSAQWPFIFNYVTNAINELVAYPEAALPD